MYLEEKEPKITIGFTAFNAAELIERAVHSALDQTWGSFEIVIVDDGSIDNTPEILLRLANKYDTIRIFRNKQNYGIAATRNRILEEAHGTFVAFFDDDDISLPNRVSDQYRRIVEYESNYANGQMVICHTARTQIYPGGKRILCGTMGEKEGKIAPNGLVVAERILLGIPLEDGYGACATCSQMGRLSTYRALNGFDTNLYRVDDTDFVIRLAKVGGHFVGISKPLVIQTMTKSSDKTLDQEYRDTLVLFEKHRDVMNRYGQYDFTCKWIEVKYEYYEARFGSFVKCLIRLFIQHPYWTLKRLLMAVPNIKQNTIFSRFRLGEDDK